MTLFVLALANAAELRSDMTRISPEEVYVMTCATAVEDAGSDHQKVIDLWVACDTEAVRRELDGARPFIRGQIAMSEIARDYSRLAAEDPLEYARVVLAVSAQRRDAALPFDDVQAAWLRVMQDSEARMNVEDVRSVTIRWQTPEPLLTPLPGVACSSGAACASAKDEPSHVLAAIGLTPEAAASTIRLSLGRSTTSDHVAIASEALQELAD